MRLPTALALVLLALALPLGGSAQTKLPTKEKVEKEFRRICDLFNAKDVDALVQDSKVAVGFGWRTAAARSTGMANVSAADVAARGNEPMRDAIKRFLDSMDYHHYTIEELHTSVEGDVGLAWGLFVEDFKIKGQPAEKARVRFTHVMKKEGEHWRPLLFHRDIQPFDEHGRYLAQFTRDRREASYLVP